MSKKKTKEEFIKEATEKHKGKYDYSKVDYVNTYTKVCIICKDHGEFWQTPNNHTQGKCCPKCSGHYVPTTEEWIASVRKIHSDKYDYSKVKYVSAHTKVCIICPEHGEFWQEANSHIRGQGCSKCANEANGKSKRPSLSDFITKARKVHGDKYDYSNVKYVNAFNKVYIICPKHGEFEQIPKHHTHGHGCPKCNVENRTLKKEEFIEKSRSKHSDKYDYSKVKYVNNKTNVCIICHKHGEFWQIHFLHMQGVGCPKCNLSHLERNVMNYLDEVGITYDYQKHFDWLGRQSLDFYIPDYNVGIECQGEQHFFPVEHFGGDDMFKQTLERDKRKKALCEKHGVKLLYFGNTPNYDTFLGEVVHDDVQYLIDYLKNDK